MTAGSQIGGGQSMRKSIVRIWLASKEKARKKRKEKVIPVGVREPVQQNLMVACRNSVLGAGILGGEVEYFIKGIINLSIP